MSVYIKSRKEFLLDGASYFSEKSDLYLDIKDRIAGHTKLPLSMIRVCGSAYWGKSFTTEKDFSPGVSDLDVALVSDQLFVRALSEVRIKTFNFTNLTLFPTTGAPEIFQDYAYKKGIIRIDQMPKTDTKTWIDSIFQNVSKSYLQHFNNINAVIYDSEMSFTNKQTGALLKFGGNND